MATAKEKAAALKDEGNAHFSAKRWMKAYEKYTAAIEFDPQNAIYYANRSAASLEQKKCWDHVVIYDCKFNG